MGTKGIMLTGVDHDPSKKHEQTRTFKNSLKMETYNYKKRDALYLGRESR